MLCGLQVGALGVIEILYDFLFLLETVGPETPPSNLCFHIDSKLPWSPNGGKVQPQWDCRRGLRHTNQAKPPGGRRQGKVRSLHNNRIPCKVAFVNDLRGSYWMRYKVNTKCDAIYS